MVSDFNLGSCSYVSGSSYSCLSSHVVDDIGSNIEGAHAATSQGTTQLVKASKTQKSNSSLVSSSVILRVG